MKQAFVIRTESFQDDDTNDDPVIFHFLDANIEKGGEPLPVTFSDGIILQNVFETKEEVHRHAAFNGFVIEGDLCVFPEDGIFMTPMRDTDGEHVMTLKMAPSGNN